MTPRRRRPARPERDPAREQFERGLAALHAHPLFHPLLMAADVVRQEGNLCPPRGWVAVTSTGAVHVHPTRVAEPDEWVYVLAHALLHLGFGHVRRRDHPRAWNAACDCVVSKFLADLKLGRPPEDMRWPGGAAAGGEDRLYESFRDGGVPPALDGLGTAGPAAGDMVVLPARASRRRPVDWEACFGEGLAQAVASAVDVAGGWAPELGASRRSRSPAQRARSWFMSSYPLLGSLAAAFELVEDQQVCHRMGISVAAVCAETREVYINPAAGLDEYECRFVMAHELLHVGLRHVPRRQGRDPWLWNVACDYVVNGWLVELGLGELPKVGVLYDPALKGESAERVYDRIVTDIRRYRKLATLRGVGLGDMLERGRAEWWAAGDGVALDEFYRRALTQGLAYHERDGRGFLPSGLVEEIRALDQPPIPWDVELAKWFDHHFSPVERERTYARLSRRQSASPAIPRPHWRPAPGAEDGRTFGVLLDTSGSMDRALLAKALGAIASYSIARDVSAVRVVFCDAATYDEGYMAPEAVAGRVRVRGRGGTVLQPGVELLERAEDFPREAPLLIITDGLCDVLRIRREHAFLVPAGRSLPFVPKGPVFRLT